MRWSGWARQQNTVSDFLVAVHRRERGKQIGKYLTLDDHVRIGKAERAPGL